MAMINFSAESKINAEWAYSDNEVVFSDVVIGRGMSIFFFKFLL